MSIIPSFLSNLFEKEADVLSWVWVPDDHVRDSDSKPVPTPSNFVSGDDYVVMRLAEMYLKTTRVLWREFYPLVHSFVAYGDPAAPRSTASIAGPGQLRELGTDNLDRVIGLSYRLAGPLVYDGQDIELLAGLYAVPSRDGAKVLIDTLSQLSGLVTTFKQANDIATVVKGGVEGLLGLEGTRLTLGIRDALRAPGAGAGRQARPGFLVAVNAPAASVRPSELWIKGGRLYEGADLNGAQPFASHDMMLFELHRGPSRASNWATLPSLAPHVGEFDGILKGDGTVQELKTKLNKAFVAFEADIDAAIDLTWPDKAAIRSVVADDLKQRVAKIEGGGLFGTRSFDDVSREKEVRSFSPLGLPELHVGEPMPKREEGLPVFS